MDKQPAPFSTQQRMQMLRQIEAILKKNPKDLNALVKGAQLYEMDNDFAEAMRLLSKAHKIDRKNHQILSKLAEVCHRGRYYSEARRYGRKLVQLQPRNAALRIFYADVLQKNDKPELSAENLKIALEIDPGNRDALQLSVKAAKMIGDDKTVAELQKHIDLVSPHDPTALYERAHAQENKPEDLTRLEALISESLIINQANQKACSVLYFALGKVNSDLDQKDIAFECWNKANRAALIPPDTTTFVPIDNVRAVFTKRFVEERMRFGIQAVGPIFVFGMPRSGTTLVESLLAGHSKVTPGGEIPHLGTIAEDAGFLSPDTHAVIKMAERLGAANVRKMGETYFASTQKFASQNPFFTDKMPHNFLWLGLAKVMMPNVLSVHCRRHPIDNCLSLYSNMMGEFHNRYKSDLKRLGLYYRQYWNLMKHWRENVPGGFLEVYYEDTVANTELVARKMIDYIGLEWEDGVMDRQKSQKSVKTLSAWQVRQPVYTSSAGRWKKYEKHLGPLIDALGPVVEEYEAELAALDQD